ncbi:unnamed protein product [Nesidiocoris tenuis]|uniref:Uncharacterized protein n=1 Tax=Nesidiocoris tenuis TaxID=355587 RepID=A0A6H5GJL2_9HEMI|nr:unnamed protein product [Nesidiocoris tenuis]
MKVKENQRTPPISIPSNRHALRQYLTEAQPSSPMGRSRQARKIRPSNPLRSAVVGICGRLLLAECRWFRYRGPAEAGVRGTAALSLSGDTH